MKIIHKYIYLLIILIMTGCTSTASKINSMDIKPISLDKNIPMSDSQNSTNVKFAVHPVAASLKETRQNLNYTLKELGLISNLSKSPNKSVLYINALNPVYKTRFFFKSIRNISLKSELSLQIRLQEQNNATITQFSAIFLIDDKPVNYSELYSKLFIILDENILRSRKKNNHTEYKKQLFKKWNPPKAKKIECDTVCEKRSFEPGLW